MTTQQADTAPPPSPPIHHAFSATVLVGAPIELGTIDAGAERFIPILGGEIYGPRLDGRILPVGGDWQTVRGDGRTVLLARYFIEASDGTVIAIENLGMRAASPEVIDRLAKGLEVPAGVYYSAGSPQFRVRAGPHDWLRRRMFIARGIRRPSSLMIDFFTID